MNSRSTTVSASANPASTSPRAKLVSWLTLDGSVGAGSRPEVRMWSWMAGTAGFRASSMVSTGGSGSYCTFTAAAAARACSALTAATAATA